MNTAPAELLKEYVLQSRRFTGSRWDNQRQFEKTPVDSHRLDGSLREPFTFSHDWQSLSTRFQV